MNFTAKTLQERPTCSEDEDEDGKQQEAEEMSDRSVQLSGRSPNLIYLEEDAMGDKIP